MIDQIKIDRIRSRCVTRGAGWGGRVHRDHAPASTYHESWGCYPGVRPTLRRKYVDDDRGDSALRPSLPSSIPRRTERDRGDGRVPVSGRAVRRDTSDRPTQTKGRRKPKVDRRRGRGNRGGRRSNDARPKKAPLPRGVVHIQSSFNNTIVTVTNLRGRVIAWSSAGANGFKGARKATPFAAKVAARAVGRVSFDQGLKLVKVNVRGGGSGRETAMRGLIEAGLRLAVIRDVTGVPHNGCRPPKKRRV